MLNPDDIRAKIEAALPGAEVEVQDTTGTGDHFMARVVAPQFEGRSMVEQHQLVYAPLRAEIGTGELHALALQTFTPAEWDRRRRTT